MSLSKAQVFSADVIAAVFLLVIALSIISVYWDNKMNSLQEKTELAEMYIRASQISDILAKAGGTPNWEQRNATVIGLAIWNRIIDVRKLSAFMGMDYNKSKDILGIKGYEYYFRLANNTKGFLSGNKQVYIKRIVIHNGLQNMEFALSK